MDEMTYRRAAVMWAFIVMRQGDRLDEAAGEYNKALLDQFWLDRRDAGTLSGDWASHVEQEVGDGMNWWVTWTFGADQYFFLSAAAQLRKCVLKLPDDGLPEIPNSKMIRLLRNFVEHWEDPSGESAVKLRDMIPDAVPGRAAFTKKDVWIEGVSTTEIVMWASDVARALRANAAEAGDVLPDPSKPLPEARPLRAPLTSWSGASGSWGGLVIRRGQG
ncbi:hypothetical protein [Amycolatopsis sp. NPDC051071]|uniref:hypothetical protein n=1 Tax=Amycolatopsis sp. NPDC051071 TaxID=3154637 RepID=UPI003442D54F